MTAALPRTVNQDVIAAITPVGRARELFGWLCGLPFVTGRGGSWAYHEVVRAAMLRLQRAQAPSEWRSNHVMLAEANAGWARDTVGSTDQQWANARWADHTREETYHLLCADSTGNLPTALASGVRAAKHSTLRARQWAQLIADAGRDVDDPALRQWGKRLRDGIRDNDLSQYLTCLINDAHLDTTTLITALEQRGEGHRLAGRYGEALADFDRVIELDPNRARVTGSRGETYRLLQRYDEAVADYSRAIELDPREAWVITSRGRAYRLLERYDEAFADYSRALELDPDRAWIITSRGRAYQASGRHEEAVADYSRAIELDPSYVPALARRAETYHAMKRYSDALADLNRTIELDPSYALIVACRIETYQAMERYGGALALFNRAKELDPYCTPPTV